MKVGIWLNDDYSPQEGGGYSYYDKLVKAIDGYVFAPEVEVVFVTTKPVIGLKKGIVNIGTISWLGKTLKKLVERLPHMHTKYKWLEYAFKQPNKLLLQAGVQVLYYPIQAQYHIPGFPFIATNWDIGHLTTYPFPEMISGGGFSGRELFYRQHLPQALCIFAESEAGKKELVQYLGIAEKKVKVVPLFAGNSTSVNSEQQQHILSRLTLASQRYFFYPAQFWAHKNHYNLLKAFQLLLQEYSDLKLVFTGSDKGNLSYIKKVADNLKLNDRVLFLGFVSNETLFTLYSNALALVMPSFLGPTNMPLLEAQELGCPVICSNMEGHKEMLQEGALYFRPESIKEMAMQMKTVLDPVQRQRLLEKSNQVKISSIFNMEKAVQEIEKHLLDLMSVRNTWL